MKSKMSFFANLDLIFPFVVLSYGAIVTIVLSSDRLMARAEWIFRDSPLMLHSFENLKASRILALVCLGIGFFWSLQTLCL
jgi:hypothetical protein